MPVNVLGRTPSCEEGDDVAAELGYIRPHVWVLNPRGGGGTPHVWCGYPHGGRTSRDHEKAPIGGADEDTSDVGMTTPLVNCAPYKWCRESSDPEAL